MSVPLAYAIWELHPTTNHFPIAFLMGGLALDSFAWWRERQEEQAGRDTAKLLPVAQLATGLLIAGVAGGVIAAIAGAIAYATVPIYDARGYAVMNWHAGLQLAALALFAWVTFLRWLDWTARPTPPVRLLAIAAALILVAGSYLGGYLVYHAGAGFLPEWSG